MNQYRSNNLWTKSCVNSNANLLPSFKLYILLTFCISLCCYFFLCRSKSFLLIGFVKSKQQFQSESSLITKFSKNKQPDVKIRLESGD